MNPDKPANVAASVRDRLFNLARQNGEEFGLVLSRFAIERLLYRLSLSPYRESFLLKGAVLFTVWQNVPRRPTRDVDFLGIGDASTDRLVQVFRSLCALDGTSEDGLLFDEDSVSVSAIREEQRYGGLRVRMQTRLAQARIPLRVDVGFGDAVTPPAREMDYPTLLPLPAPRLPIYPPETVIAEKYQAMVELGIGNSRMKDFYDVWIMARHLSFDGALLSQAVAATFERRQTSLPATVPIALQNEFGRDAARVTQWRAFTRKNRLQHAPELEEVVGELQAFLWPLTEHLRTGSQFTMRWTPQNRWQE